MGSIFKSLEIEVDISKQQLSEVDISKLLHWASRKGLAEKIEAFFTGKLVNNTEHRAALHPLLRMNQNLNKDTVQELQQPISKIKACKAKIKAFCEAFHKGKHCAYNGKKITTIVNIGIGGSDLGADLVTDALRFKYPNAYKTYFVNNIDAHLAYEVLKEIKLDETLFLVVSKSFTTEETLANAVFFKEKVKAFFQSDKAIEHHFIAVTAKENAAKDFGISANAIFPMWDWIGGRFSLWSAVGLPIALSLGFDVFEELHKGGAQMDEHFRRSPFSENLPIILALIGIWNNNQMDYASEAVVPYDLRLRKLVPWLQQLSMESNGKSVNRDGSPIHYHTAPAIWGGVGTSVQHSFFQMLHQGTRVVPVTFLSVQKPEHDAHEMHQKLLTNAKAQMLALNKGRTVKELSANNVPNELIPFKTFEGNRPSTSIALEQLNPKTLGSLLVMYEHQILVQGILWDINPFDQFGVELGKEMAKDLEKQNIY